MNKITGLLIPSSVSVSFSYCSGSGKMNQSSSNKAKGLKDYYKEYFLIGAAVTPRSLHGLDGPGRKNYPLLFDINCQPKKAYWDIMNFNAGNNINKKTQNI